MQRERVKPATGVPFFFEIEKLGVRRNSQYAPSGYEFYYEGTLHEGQLRKPAGTYFAPEAHAAIERAMAQVGDTIRLLKGKDGSYDVRVLSDAHEYAEPVREMPRRIAPPASNGNGYVNGATVRQPDPEPIPTSHPFEERYARMFVVAARSLHLAHELLMHDGDKFKFIEPFTWDDIRALGIHFAIAAERKEERR